MAGWIDKLREAVTREKREADLERELRAHLEEEEEEQREAGVRPEEAPYAARRALGNVPLIQEDTRSAWDAARLETVVRELFNGLRQDVGLRVAKLAKAACLHRRGRAGARAWNRCGHHDYERDPGCVARSVPDVQGRRPPRQRAALGSLEPERRIPDVLPGERVPGLSNAGAEFRGRHRRTRRRHPFHDLRRHGPLRRRHDHGKYVLDHGSRRPAGPHADARRREARRAGGVRHEPQALGWTFRRRSRPGRHQVRPERHADDAHRHHAPADLQARWRGLAAGAAGSRRSRQRQRLPPISGAAQTRGHARGRRGRDERPRKAHGAGLPQPLSTTIQYEGCSDHRRRRRTLPQDPLHDGRGRRALAADRLRERGEHAAEPRRGAREGDGDPRFARRDPDRGW